MLACLIVLCGLLTCLCGIQIWTHFALKREMKIARGVMKITKESIVEAIRTASGEQVKSTDQSGLGVRDSIEEIHRSIEGHKVAVGEIVRAISDPKLAPQIEELTTAAKRLGGFADGQGKVAIANVEAITRLEAVVDKFVRHAFGVEPGKRNKDFQDLADENEVDRMIRDDKMSREDAMRQVRQDRTYNFGD